MIITVPLVVFLSITFVLVFLFVRTIDHRKWLTFLVSLGLTPLVYFYAIYPMINIFSNFHHQKYFSSKSWKDKPTLRYELLDDLQASEILVGLSKSDLKAQLGTYEWLTWDDRKKQHNTNLWNYALGQEPGAFNTEKDCIEIVFKSDTVHTLRPYKEAITFDGKD